MAKAVLRSLNADTVHLLPVYRVPDGQTLATLDCPRLVARSRNMISARLLMDVGLLMERIIADEGDAAWRPIELRLLPLAVLTLRAEGDWSLYAPGVEESPEWPAVDDRDLEASLPAIRRRVATLMELRQDDVDALDAALERSSKLSEGERKN